MSTTHAHIAQLEREVTAAEAALEVAEETRRKSDPEYIRAQVQRSPSFGKPKRTRSRISSST